MPLYVVVNNADGTRQRVATVPMEPTQAQHLVVFSSLDAEPSEDTHEWDTATETYVERPGPGSSAYRRTRLSKGEFRQRLGQSCRMAINMRLLTPPTTAAELEVVAALTDLKDELLSRDFVDVTHPVTQQGVALLVSLGFITSEQAAQVLAPSTLAEE